jgi:hypothetical protein
MSNNIINAAPMVIDLGRQDLSTKPYSSVQVEIPTHLPKVYIYAEKGPTTTELIPTEARNNTYGSNSFNPLKPYFNHATLLSNEVAAQYNAQMMQRVIPDDCGPEANLLLSVDVLPTKIKTYQRELDGSYKYDTNNEKILDTVKGEVDGFKVKFVVSSISTVDLLQTKFGRVASGPGTQTDTTTNTQSVLKPLIQIKAASRGAWGNNSGIRIYSPDQRSPAGIASALLKKAKIYPIRASVIRRPDDKTTPRIVENTYGEQYVQMGLKPDGFNPLTDGNIYMGNIFLDNYQELTDSRYPKVFGDIGEMHMYQENIDELLAMFYEAEIENGFSLDNPSWSDFDLVGSTDENKYLFNMFGGHSSSGIFYDTFEIVGGSGTTLLSQFTNLYMNGGFDGTMNDELFAELVSREVVEYGNPNSSLNDMAVNVESILYDSGFPLKTKYDLINFIALRKDTFLVLSTHDVNDVRLSASEEHSAAIALRTRLANFPDSEYFGTSVFRGMIMGRSGKHRPTPQFIKYVPSSIEVAYKSAAYMGNGSGKWKAGKNFDMAPGSVIERMFDFNNLFTPATARNKDWDAGLNWVQNYDTRSQFFPALKTCYDNDTSVLNSYLTAMAICEVNKIAHAIHREFTGVSHLTNAQLVDRVNNSFVARVAGKFDDRFVLIPDCYISENDAIRGYSWTLAIKIYAANMKTVMTTYTQAYRLDDYAGNTTGTNTNTAVTA